LFRPFIGPHIEGAVNVHTPIVSEDVPFKTYKVLHLFVYPALSSTATPPPVMLDRSGYHYCMSEEKNPAAVELGKLGGRKGGKARAEKLFSERRKETARKAARARWDKKRREEESS
jgi:hypothetical protein